MLRQLQGSAVFLVSCRATNPGDSTTTPGYLVGIDLQRKKVRSLASGLGAEGFVVTPQSQVWVGNMREDSVSIFGFENGRLDLDALVLRKKLSVPMPMRLAYEPNTNQVGIITTGGAAGSTNFRSFDAGNHQLVASTSLASRQRGWINPQGLAAMPGTYITGGINNQAVLLVDAQTLAVRGEVLLPRCPLSADADDGSCQPTMRNPNETTAAMLDGFAWSSVIPAP
jgi:DNA-binding beta-propeller fold protein YncE